MKKYKIELQTETIKLENREADASRYASYYKLKNGYLCNLGVLEIEKKFYFETLEKAQKFIEDNPLPKINICNNNLLENKTFYYFIFKLNEDFEEFEQLEEYNFFYVSEIIEN